MLSFDKLTIKSQEALQKAQQLASDFGQQQIEPLHLLAGVLDSPESIARSVLKKTGVGPEIIARWRFGRRGNSAIPDCPGEHTYGYAKTPCRLRST